MEFWLNDVQYVEKNFNMSIFQKCAEKGVDIPCFCYHENLSIAGNCRMCLVQINTSAKLVASCALPIINGIKIDTLSYRVKKARESVIEFLLVNHPLDCPICDQGGECDLQDITMVFGSDKSRFYEYFKRAVLDVDVGPFIKTVMTRCIHCTRCVRFFSEVLGINELGMLGRGNSSEISTYLLKSLDEDLSGNVIDLCPVGALTSKPYAFKARAWELNSIESIDIFDSLGSNIRIDFLNNQVLRVLPIYNKNLNEDWITNKIRFFYDSLTIQRVSVPMISIKGLFVKFDWEFSLKIFFFYFLKYAIFYEIFFLFGFYSDGKSLNSLNSFLLNLGGEIYFFDNNYNNDIITNYFLDLSQNFDNFSDIIFVGLNLRNELPVLNSKFRKLYINSLNINFWSVGFMNSYSTYPIKFLGINLFNFFDIIKGRSDFKISFFKLYYGFYSFYFFNKETNIKLFLSSWFSKYNFFNKYLKFINFSYLVPFLGRLTYNYLLNNYKNFFYDFNKKIFIFLENIENNLVLNTDKIFLVYRGSFFNDITKIAKIVLPLKTFIEDSFEYINLEGKFKKSNKIINNMELVWSNLDFLNFLCILKKKFWVNNFSWMLNFEIFSYFYFLKVNFKNFCFSKKYLNINIDLVVNNYYFFYENFIFNTNFLNIYKSNSFFKNSKNLQLASLSYLKNLSVFYLHK